MRRSDGWCRSSERLRVRGAQTTDVELEINGLLTYDRRVLKVDAARIRAAHEKVCAALGK